MKNVFMINSHTTFLTTMGVINYLGAEQSDVLLLYVRNYKNSLDNQYKRIDISYLSDKVDSIFCKNVNKKGKNQIIIEVDKFVSEDINCTFHLFAPHLAHPLWQILYTNKKCVFFSYIQEGILPYKTAFVSFPPLLGLLRNIKFRLLYQTDRVWPYRPWFLRTKIKKISNVDAFAINNKFFKYLSVKKNIVQWPKIVQKDEITFQDKHMIFIYDAFVKNGIMNSDDYIKECKNLIKEMATDYNYLKFHPGQSNQEIEIIKDYFNQLGKKYIVLDNMIPFEVIIMSQQNLSLTGYGSSLLFLAYDYGHNVFCYDSRLLKYNLYRDYRNRCGFMSFREYANK